MSSLFGCLLACIPSDHHLQWPLLRTLCCWLFSLRIERACFQSSRWKTAANSPESKDDRRCAPGLIAAVWYVFHKMSICVRRYAGICECVMYVHMSTVPLEGAVVWWLMVTQQQWWTTSRDLDTEPDSSIHLCLFNGSRNMEQTGSWKNRVSFPATADT